MAKNVCERHATVAHDEPRSSIQRCAATNFAISQVPQHVRAPCRLPHTIYIEFSVDPCNNWSGTSNCHLEGCRSFNDVLIFTQLCEGSTKALTEGKRLVKAETVSIVY